jgi:antitoxin CcdA
MARAHKKTATNLSLRPELVRRAKQLKLNLSQILEDALKDEIRKAERAAWLAENQDAIDSYNQGIAKRGVFSDGRRRF